MRFILFILGALFLVGGFYLGKEWLYTTSTVEIFVLFLPVLLVLSAGIGMICFSLYAPDSIFKE